MKVVKNVAGVHETTRQTKWFRPGDDVPKEFKDSITNPKVFDTGERSENYAKWTVDQLREELADREADTDGKKADLVERLEALDAADED